MYLDANSPAAAILYLEIDGVLQGMVDWIDTATGLFCHYIKTRDDGYIRRVDRLGSDYKIYYKP